jgi:hypothetical protein
MAENLLPLGEEFLVQRRHKWTRQVADRQRTVRQLVGYL